MAAEKKKTTEQKKATPVKKKTASSPSKGAAKTTRKAQGGLASPVKPDKTLAAIVGSDPLTRAVLTQKVWDYIKKNDLQDPKDRRSIRADAKLKPVFGGKDKVTMFEMTKLVNQHVSS
jgi:upstream activation factor subunit UAF30